MPASPPKSNAAGTATIKRLRPGAPGTKRLLEQYGDALVCVRYRLDTRLNRRLTTVELIVDDRPKKPEKNRLATRLLRRNRTAPARQGSRR